MTGQQEARDLLDTSHRLLMLPNIDIDRQAEYLYLEIYSHQCPRPRLLHQQSNIESACMSQIRRIQT